MRPIMGTCRPTGIGRMAYSYPSSMPISAGLMSIGGPRKCKIGKTDTIPCDGTPRAIIFCRAVCTVPIIVILAVAGSTISVCACSLLWRGQGLRWGTLITGIFSTGGRMIASIVRSSSGKPTNRPPDRGRHAPNGGILIWTAMGAGPSFRTIY